MLEAIVILRAQLVHENVYFGIAKITLTLFGWLWLVAGADLL